MSKDEAMGERRQIRFRVKPEATKQVEELILEYAEYVAGWVREHGPEWRWATYRQTDDPARFVSVMWHRDQAARERHQEAPGTERFAEALYPHVLENEQIAVQLVADSERVAAAAGGKGKEVE